MQFMFSNYCSYIASTNTTAWQRITHEDQHVQAIGMPDAAININAACIKE